jgi:two-component system, NarL family, nitrate/nitrite response regulator NarL
MNVSVPANIRLLLIDDHTLFRESLARLLQSEPGFEVVANCSSLLEAVEILKSRQIDMVLLDLDLGQERGGDLLEVLQEINFKGKVLLVTAGVNERDVLGMIQQGIAGIFMKHNPPALLVEGIRDAMKGKVLFDQDLLRRGLEVPGATPSGASHSGLTTRERLVLSLVFEGLANKEIADRIQISESAVKSCLQHLFTKTGVRTRSQLVRVALEKYREEL